VIEHQKDFMGGNMSIPAGLKYTKEHEWVRIEGDGRTVAAEEAYAVVESVKAVSDIYAPIGGEIIEVNRLLESEPEKLNTDPYGAGWIAKVTMWGDREELMSDDEYTTFLEE